jgi:hypothetical protein
MFLGHLMSYAGLMASRGIRLREPEEDPGYLDRFCKIDLLKIIGFEEGIPHFNARREQHNDRRFNEVVQIENYVIGQRVIRRAKGQRTGEGMDDEIELEDEYRRLIKEFEAEFGPWSQRFEPYDIPARDRQSGAMYA